MKSNIHKVIPQLSTDKSRQKIRDYSLINEAEIVNELVNNADIAGSDRLAISERATDLIKTVRRSSSPGIMENFLAEYGLTTREGVALMCLAEALLRVPDSQTIDELIEDKISPGNWNVAPI